MPRNVDPGSIRVGKGLAPEGTVEDNSLRYPERDVDPLRVHIHDPSRAHMASSIGIVDEGDCYVSDEVEGALQEICGGASAGRLNGLVSGGTFNELGNVANGSGAVTTTTLTLENPTEIMVGAGVYDASGLVADLSGLGAGDYYVYFDTDSASPTFRTLVVSGAAPEVETGAGIEDVLLAKVTYDGADVTAWQDGRFFVRNLDRKVQYSSRQGENVDAWSEGCFATLQSFFLWMAEYGDGGTSEEEKGTVLIRGTHALSGTLTVPTNHLQFIGDGEAIIEGGNFAGPLVDVTGRSDITFRGLSFRFLGAPVTSAILGGDLTTDLLVEDCFFNGSFPDSVLINSAGSSAVNIKVVGCHSDLAVNPLVLNGVSGGQVTGFVCTGAPGGPTRAVTIINCDDVVVSGCRIDGYDDGIHAQQTSARIQIVDNIVVGCLRGVRSANSQTVSITGNQIILASSGASDGVAASDSTDVSVRGNQISTSGSGSNGILFEGLSTLFTVQGNQIDGFVATPPISAPSIRGIVLEASGANAPIIGSVSDNVIRRCADGILLYGSSSGTIKDVTIGDNLLEGIVHTQDGRTNTFDSIGTRGIGLNFCAGIKITGNTLTGVGVLLDNARNPVVLPNDVFPLPILARNSDTLHITDNTVLKPVAQGVGVSQGIVVMVSGYGAPFTATDIEVCGNELVFDTANSNAGILFGAIDSVDAPGFTRVEVTGNQITGGKGVNTIRKGIDFSSGDPFNPGNVYGAAFSLIEVRDNRVTSFDLSGITFLSEANAAQVHPSIFNRVTVDGNTLVGSAPTGAQRGVGMDVGSQTQSAGVTHLVVNGNTISGGTGAYGVQIRADKDAASPAAANFSSVHITDNLFTSLRDGVAIEVERTGVFTTTARHDLVITGNRLPSTSTALSAATSGLVLDLGSVDFTGLTVEDNLFEVSDDTAFAVDVSLSAPGPALVSLEDASFSRNKVRAGDSQPGVRFTTQRASIVGLRFTGNDISSSFGLGASAGVQSVFLNLTNSEATAVNIRRLEVEGNTIVGGRFQINGTGTTFTNCSVSDNTLGVTAFAEITERAAITVRAESTNATTICSGFRVEGNTITGGNYGISFGMEDFSSEDGTRISGNTISGLVAPTNTGSIGIYAHAFNRTNIVTNDLRIEDNAVSDYTYRGIYLGLDPSTNINAYAVSVSQNTVLGTHNNIATGDATDGVAIEVFMQCNGLCDAVGLRVDGNRICESLESGVVRRPYRGILFTAPTNTTSKEPLQSVSISENVIHVGSGYGIDAHFHQVLDNPYFLYDAKFDRNQIRSVDGKNGLAVEATCRFQTMSISGNTVMGLNRTDPGLHEHGIWLYHEFTEAVAVSDGGGTDIVGRIAPALTSYAFTVNGDPVDAVAWEDLTISGNTVMWNAEIPQNPPSFTDKAAIAVSHVGDGQVAVCLWGYSLTGNTLRAYKTEAGLNTNRDARLVGYSGSIVRTSQVLWPDESIPLFDTTQYLQRGWVFTGNSATDFMRKDRSAALFYGLCVRAIFGPLAAPTAESGASSGNAAYDFGAGPGWGVFGLTGGTTNLNGEPRTF